ncbi:hypothetical protein VN97_g9425 [Penicillium thymicola]|uniref:Uncharacterized protein n=1 Tax=Penicillium thymicola TaxID=293382 RepID=A0AAI9TBM2_PENTH|nr:hypothetical protein VN97_g9425 [Penicillium thymicola]
MGYVAKVIQVFFYHGDTIINNTQAEKLLPRKTYPKPRTIATSRRYCSSFTIATRGIIIPGMRVYKPFSTPFSLLTVFYPS